MDIAFDTNFVLSTGSPEPYLKLLSEAGFTHLHWCHHWNTDFLYSKSEIAKCAEWLKTYGLKLLDIHGSEGKEKNWASLEEYERKVGVELVINRVEMFAELQGSGSVVMHIPWYRTVTTEEQRKVITSHHEALKRSLDELMPVLEKNQVRIAVENTVCDTFETIADLLNTYPEEYLGFTYDSGHGNVGDRWTFDPPHPGEGLDYLDQWKHRLQAVHLHDNDGLSDCHQPPFMGTVDWERLAKIIAESSYVAPGKDGFIRPMSYEVLIQQTPYWNPELRPEEQPENKLREFLADACTRCEKFSRMVAANRS